MSGFPITGVPGVPGGVATLSTQGSVLDANDGSSVGVGSGTLLVDTSGYSTAIGTNAGAANTTGMITAVGFDALQSNTTGGVGGQGNTAVGGQASQYNTTSPNNSSFGYQTLRSLVNDAIGNNTALGYNAGYALLGHQNTVVGADAFLSLTGNNNTVVGMGAMAGASSALVTGNVAIGEGSLTGVMTNTANNNTVVGTQAGQAITSGQTNCLFGELAGQAITSGNSNAIIGDGAGANIVTGFYNIAVGENAGPTVDIANTTCLGRATSCAAAGGVAIGFDHSNGAAAATIQDQIMLGTSLHTVYCYATNTSLGATASTPTIANTATGVQVNATKDVMLYLTCSLAGTGFTLKIGPTSTPAYTLVNNVAVTIGDCFAVRVPGGWYVSWQATTATFANQQAVTC